MNSWDKEELSLYIEKMKKQKTQVLTRQEEITLGKKIKKGNKEAKNKLFFANVRLVVMIAKKFMRPNINMLDLIQEGNIGLLKAIDKYDYKKNYKFSTYAFWWIRHYIQLFLYKNHRDIPIPIQKEEELRKIEKATRFLQKEKQCVPTHSEIAKYMKKKQADIEYILNIGRTTLSLDKKIGDDKGAEIKDVYVADEKWDTEKIINENNLKQEITKALEKLIDIEKKILLYRYGFIDGTKYTLKETSKIFDSSPETIRQIEINALNKIREHNSTLKDFI